MKYLLIPIIMDFSIFTFFRLVGGSFCHQLAERSFIIGGYPLPVCARCTGIMLGIFSGFCFIRLSKRSNADKPFSAVTLILMIAGYLLLAFDGLSSYIGLRESDNISRIATGILAGYVFPMFFTLIKNYNENSCNNKKIIGVFDIALVLTGAIGVSALMLADMTAVWILLSIIIAFSIIYFFANIYMLVMTLVNPAQQKKRRLAWGVTLSCATVIIFSGIRNIILH